MKKYIENATIWKLEITTVCFPIRVLKQLIKNPVIDQITTAYYPVLKNIYFETLS